MKYRLDDIFDLQMGKTPSRNNLEYWETQDNKWISIGDLSQSGKYISKTKEYLSNEAVRQSVIKIIPAGTVIMSFKLSIGKTAITQEDMYSNEAIMAFHDKKVVEMLPEYIYYLFKCKDWDKGTNKAVMGKTLNKATLSQIQVDICSIEEQHRIVKNLNDVSEFIDNIKMLQDDLDMLIKSRFVEMFGKCGNLMKLEELCSIITDGTHQPPKFQDAGIPFIFVSNLAGDKITYNAEKFISEETYNELYKRTPIEKGDVLLSTVGSYGHPAVVEEDRKFLFQRHIAYLKPKCDLINSYYLHGALLAPDGQRQIEERVKGIAQKTLNLSEIRRIMIPVPSMEQQKQFEQFTHQTDKLKVELQKTMNETQILFDSLMQKYFG